MYSSENIEEVEKLFIKYKVSYIYVGELENYYYKKDGIEKFKIACKTQDTEKVKELLIKYVSGYIPEE